MKSKLILIFMIFGYISISIASEKNNEEYIFELDSVITYNILMPTNDTIPDEKTEYYYDEHINVINEIIYGWNTMQNKWDNYKKNNYNYNNDMLNYESQYQWDSNNSLWEYPEKIEYLYDGNGNKIESITYLDLLNTGSLEKDSRSTYYYDNKNNCILTEWYNWDDELDDWKIKSKTEYTYDGNNNCILKKQNLIDFQFNEWTKFDSVIYQFNENNDQTLYIQYLWDNIMSEWVGANKTETVYTINNRTHILSNNSPNGWKYFRKYDNIYDDNENILSSDEYLWYTTLNDWSQTGKWIYLYDSSYNLIKKNYYNRSNLEADLKIAKIIEYYYSSYLNNNTSNSLIDMNGLKEPIIWPNPSNGILYINSENKTDLSIFNVHGKLILHKILNEGVNSLNLDKTPQGIYFINITDSDMTDGLIIRRVIKY